jgi:hypothetical protein
VLLFFLPKGKQGHIVEEEDQKKRRRKNREIDAWMDRCVGGDCWKQRGKTLDILLTA